HHAISVVLCHSILLFDLRRKHSFVPTAYLHRRRAQRRSRTALLQRRRRLVLDGREHGGRLPASGWLAARESEGSLPLAAINRANHACMGLCLSRRHHAISVVLCHSILLFDLRRKHSFVPTAYLHRRRAQRRSRTPLFLALPKFCP